MTAARCLYFIRAENGLTKIGIAHDPWDRLQDLRTGSPSRLSLLTAYEYEDAAAIERVMHRRLRMFWVTGE